MKTLTIFTLLVLTLVSCSKNGDDRIAEQENIRAQEQVNAENDNRTVLSAGPEKELNRIKNFMKAVKGEYKTAIEIMSIPLDIFVDIVPSKEIVFYDRVRNVEEIQAELNELSLTIKVLIENPNIPNSGSTCIFEGHKPDTKNGIMKLIKDGCKNTFVLGLDETTNPTDITTASQTYIDTLSGYLSTGVSSTKHKFSLERL